MVLRKMYVKWKLLLSFGTIFWILLCLYDTYFIDPVTKFYYADSDEYGWLATVSEDEINTDPTNTIETISLSENKYSFGECLLFWNILIFLSTVVFCLGSKMATNHLWLKNKTKEIFHNEMVKKTAGSKIPVFSVAPKSLTNFLGNTDYTVMRSSINLDVSPSKDDMTAKYMEKQCAKLRDDMISAQSSSLKETAAISRKLEAALREKRDLCKKLNAINKESTTARQQVDQLLCEKCSLLERLDCASKEFKQNTKTKKVALAKLEESQANVALLMKEVDRYQTEKRDLENKFKKLDVENQQLKECVNYYETGPNPDEVKSLAIDQGKLFNSYQESVKITTNENLSQSHKDVQRVQKRLSELEKSLDKLKFTNWNRQESKKTKVEPSKDLKQQPEITIPTIPESPLDVPLRCSLTTDNLTDEQRQNILIPGDYFCDELSPKTKNENLIDEVNGQKMNEFGDSCMKQFEFNPVKQFTPKFVADVKNNGESSNDDDEETDEWESQGRIISNSPAFQRFLHKMDQIDKLQAKYAIPTNMF